MSRRSEGFGISAERLKALPVREDGDHVVKGGHADALVLTGVLRGWTTRSHNAPDATGSLPPVGDGVAGLHRRGRVGLCTGSRVSGGCLRRQTPGIHAGRRGGRRPVRCVWPEFVCMSLAGLKAARQCNA